MRGAPVGDASLPRPATAVMVKPVVWRAQTLAGCCTREPSRVRFGGAALASAGVRSGRKAASSDRASGLTIFAAESIATEPLWPTHTWSTQ